MKSQKALLTLALVAFSQYNRPLLLDSEGNVFMPQNSDHASRGFTQEVYGFDGNQLRKIAKGELAKLPRHADGRQLIGAGALVVEADPVPEAQEPKTPGDDSPEPVAPVADSPEPVAPVADSPEPVAPVADTPTTEAPVADTPATEAHVADTPATEAPVAEAPVAEAPVADTPAKPQAKQKAKQP